MELKNSFKAFAGLCMMLFFFMAGMPTFAQCPADYTDNTADIPWTDTGGTLDPNACPPNTVATLNGRTDIVAAFNNARTIENGQTGTAIPADMTVDQLAADDNAWNAKSNSEKALILMNLERVARGIPPFEGVDPNVVTVAQSYADYLRTTNQFDHDLNCIPAPTPPASCSPTYRMEQNAAIKTHQEFACRSENLAAVFAPSMACAPLPLEQAIYGWLYGDTGQGNGHRKAVLYNIPATNDNYGTTGKEGLIGVGVSIGLYQGSAYGIVMVFDFFDPNASYNPALPVELVSFTGAIVDNDVQLNWQTASEKNNYGFEVERWKSGLNNSSWEKIGFVFGQGSSNSKKEYSFLDKNPIGGDKFAYRLKQIDNDGQFEYSNEVEIAISPKDFILFQNYPNPFNPVTSINYSLPIDANITLAIYDVLGRLITTLVNETKEAGNYSYSFDASKLSSGMYFYKMESENFTETRKMLLLK